MLLHAQPLWSLPTLVVSVYCAAEMGGLVHLSLAELLPQDPAGSRTTSAILAAMQSRGGNTTAFIYPVRVPLYCVLDRCTAGYPRNMEDTVDYLARAGRLDGVILLNWPIDTLHR